MNIRLNLNYILQNTSIEVFFLCDFIRILDIKIMDSLFF